jgi:hypothetical protein
MHRVDVGGARVGLPQRNHAEKRGRDRLVARVLTGTPARESCLHRVIEPRLSVQPQKATEAPMLLMPLAELGFRGAAFERRGLLAQAGPAVEREPHTRAHAATKIAETVTIPK